MRNASQVKTDSVGKIFCNRLAYFSQMVDISVTVRFMLQNQG